MRGYSRHGKDRSERESVPSGWDGLLQPQRPTGQLQLAGGFPQEAVPLDVWTITQNGAKAKRNDARAGASTFQPSVRSELTVSGGSRTAISRINRYRALAGGRKTSDNPRGSAGQGAKAGSLRVRVWP